LCSLSYTLPVVSVTMGILQKVLYKKITVTEEIFHGEVQDVFMQGQFPAFIYLVVHSCSHLMKTEIV